MKLFDGVTKTDYQDIFRTIGRIADERGLRSLRVLEVEDGIVLQGVPMSQSTYQTVLLAEDDLRAILARAYEQREAPAPDMRPV